MSVYTRVDDRDLAALLADYALRLEDAQAARHGIENSTFLIDARAADGSPRLVVLTVFEQFDGDALAWMVVHPATRGRGVGRDFLRLLEKHHGGALTLPEKCRR
jgi:GNAT superfamily N-acetyltransferase